MFIVYAFLFAAFGNSSFLFSMKQCTLLMPFTPMIIPYNQSLFNFRSSFNPDNSQEIELNVLQKSLVPPGNDEMHALYQKVDSFLACKLPHYEQFIECINACNDAKRHDIDEDKMGRFAFYRDNVYRKTSLFFYFLKHYNVQAAITREMPPKMWSPVAKRLNLVGSCNAIEVLIHDTNALLLDKILHCHELVSFIHSNQKLDQLGNKCVSFDDDWQKRFVCDAFEVLSSPEPHNLLRDIIVVMSKAKNKGLIKEESDLGYYALHKYEPTFLENMKMNFSYDSYKGKIALLCSCIKKYNESRGSKITPTARLYRIYKAINPLHILLPDAFDKDLLNPEKIAFAECAELLDAIGEIKESYDEVVEYCIKEQYLLPFSIVT
jgi:hypothetical protein